MKEDEEGEEKVWLNDSWYLTPSNPQKVFRINRPCYIPTVAREAAFDPTDFHKIFRDVSLFLSPSLICKEI